MKAYRGTFQKKDGSFRTMRFVTLKDLPTEFVSARIKGGNSPHKLSEGMELVWDIDENAFRVFNRINVIGGIEEFEHNFNNQ
jgi:hypothetical protein